MASHEKRREGSLKWQWHLRGSDLLVSVTLHYPEKYTSCTVKIDQRSFFVRDPIFFLSMVKHLISVTLG